MTVEVDEFLDFVIRHVAEFELSASNQPSAIPSSLAINQTSQANSHIEDQVFRLLVSGCKAWNRQDSGHVPIEPQQLWSSLSEPKRQKLLQACQMQQLNDIETTPHLDSYSEAELQRAALDSLSAQVAVLNGDGTIIATNAAWKEFRSRISETVGRSHQAVEGSNYLTACETLAIGGCSGAWELAHGVREFLAGKRARFQHQYSVNVGSRSTWFLMTVSPLAGGTPGALVTHIDITAQVEAEQSWRAERDRFTRMANVAPGSIHTMCVGSDGTITFRYASPAIEDIYGVTPDQLYKDGALAKQAILPEDLARYESELAVAQAQMSKWHCEYRVCHPLKGVIWVEGRLSPVAEGDGTVAWHGFLTDITARKSADDALRKSEEHWRLAKQATAMGTWELYPDTNEIHWSENLPSMLGTVDRSDYLTLDDFYAVIHPDDREQFIHELQKAIATGQVLNCEFRCMRSDGTIRWSLTRGRIISNDSGAQQRRFIGVDLDITSRKQLEDQFHQSQKMEAIGRLAGGVAHDFNNLLTVINGYCFVLLAGLGHDDERRHHVVAIRDAGERATRLTKQLLAFSRKTIAAPQTVDVNELLADFEELLGRMVGEDVILTLDLLPESILIHADPAQFEQVVINLAVNARDAMSSGGRLIIRTNVVMRNNAETEVPQRFLELTVTDTGCGMTPAVQSRAFEPFFTTKAMGKGTGLGLSVVHGVVTQASGAISLQSEVGVGSTFHIYWPLCEAVSCDESRHTVASPTTGNETILLVEDEEGVRKIAQTALESYGYKVLSAESAEAGLQVFMDNEGNIDLLLSDLVMPGMNGRQLAKKLRETQPELRVLYISGYTSDLYVQQGVLNSTDAFLAKPFHPSTLAKKVRSVLSRNKT